MTSRDWDKELAKIDKQLASISDDELVRKPVAAGGAAASAPAPVSAGRGAAPVMTSSATDRRTMWGVTVRVGLAAALAIGVPFWPYASRCGPLLAGYLAAVAVLMVAGAWSAVATWRARMPRVHVLALAIVVWGVSLMAIEVLPRVGYANDAARVSWVCG